MVNTKTRNLCAGHESVQRSRPVHTTWYRTTKKTF